MSVPEEKKYEFIMADTHKPQPNNNKTTLFLGTSLVLVSLGLIGVVIALVIQMSIVPVNIQNVTVSCTPSDIQERFPGYFKTEQQYQELVQALKTASLDIPTENRTVCPNNGTYRFQRDTRTFFEKILKVNSVIHSLSKSRSVEERDRQRRRRFSSGGNTKFRPIHHACCISESSYIFPTTATTIDGEEVEIVQSEDLKQPFLIQSCESDPKCTLCQCFQPEPFIAKAVIYKDKKSPSIISKYGVAEVSFPGCCKCLNIAKRV